MLVTDAPAREDFGRAVDPLRKELLAHCYRMLGSVQDAEDLVQETYLRAWRAYDRFEGRSSLRTWLYRIATNACLNALESSDRRPLPTGLGEPAASADAPLVERHEMPWLEPIPDALVNVDGSDPAATVTARHSVRLAFIAALQHLPPRQRAVLVLRDVLQFKAAEVADAVGVSTAAVNSLLQRARSQLDAAALREDEISERESVYHRELLDRYVKAFEEYDIAAIVELFTSDAVWEMPPITAWYQGPETIGRLVAEQCPAEGPGDQVLLATSANGQPAFGVYMRGGDGVHRAFQLQVLDVTPAGVRHMAAFFDTSRFQTFGLPEALPPIT